MTKLKTRKPTGRVAFPLLLLEGEEKAGKSYAALNLSASERVGRTFVFDLDEGTADEYAALGPYEIVDHDGTYTDLLNKLRLACAEPSDAAKPNVIVIDSATAVWELIKDGLTKRARTSESGRRTLKRDPDAEVPISQNLWNDGKDRWGRLIHLLRNWPGIAVLVARGKEVSRVEDGKPVAGQTEWRVEAEKTLPFAVSAWVRMTRPHVATLVAVRSLTVDVPAKGIPLPAEAPLGHLLFEVLGAGGEFSPSTAIPPAAGRGVNAAKNELVDVLREGGHSDPVGAAAAVWQAIAEDVEEVTDDLWARLEGAAHDVLDVERGAA